MDRHDDDLSRFAAEGALPLPETAAQGSVAHRGAQIWHASYGSGPAVILLHGGLGHSGNWGYQIPALVEAGYRAVVVDSRGHGRSTNDGQPYAYALMADDLAAVMGALQIDRAALVGWSDGAVVALELARRAPALVAGVFFFACNVDPSGTLEFVMTPTVERCFGRHAQDYAALSATPGAFSTFVEEVGQMQQTQPNYTAEDLAQIGVPVVVAQSERDEFIRREHAEYIAQRRQPLRPTAAARGVQPRDARIHRRRARMSSVPAGAKAMETHTILRSQYHAALAMLRQAVERCPPALWESREAGEPLWQIAYHALFYTHLYLHDSLESFSAWERHREAYLFSETPPETPVDAPDRALLLAYLDFCARQVDARVPQDDLAAASGFHWLPWSRLELHLYTIRHLQQHIGELTERLGSRAQVSVAWVGAGS
jgi:pimeloyl-ACP methyl ester carboxylesterase